MINGNIRNMKPNTAYTTVTDFHTNLIHYIPKTGREHYFDKCWCFPTEDIKRGRVHHKYMKENKAKCDK